MFGIGLIEMIVLAVIALVLVIGFVAAVIIALVVSRRQD
jgi:hypothetical protein